MTAISGGKTLRFATLAIGLLLLFAGPSPGADLPGSIIAEGVPPIPPRIEPGLDAHRFSQSRARFQGWVAGRRQMLVRNSFDGMDQVFLLGTPGGELEPLTGHDMPVEWACPNPARDCFVFASDNDGDENNRFYFRDLRGGPARQFAGGRWMNRFALWSHSGRSLAFSSNARDGSDLDLYIVDPPSTASGRRLKEAEGWLVPSAWSPDDRRIAANHYSPDFAENKIHLIDVATGDDRVLDNTPARPFTIRGLLWSADGGSLYYLIDRDSEFFHLARYDLAAGRESSLTAAIPWDVDDFDLSDDGALIVLVANEDGESALHVLDARSGAEQPAPRLARGIISALLFRAKSHEFGFEWQSSRSPGGIFSVDLDGDRRSEWVKSTPCSPKAGSVPGPELIRYPSFDGRPIPAFVRRPDRKYAGRRPVLIAIHGGPSSQARPYAHGLHDYLIGELGLAIIEPNVRGSTGYGRTYEKLDDKLLREDSVRDVGALLDWIATQPDLDPTRVAVSGGSYGGYMVLACLVRYGERLRAGIDWMGFSDFASLIELDRPSVAATSREEYGDERDPEVRAFFDRISPLRNARAIRRPLLIVHGSNDPRVRVGESERIAAEVRKNGTPVWSILFDGEGHGVRRREHALYFQHAQVLFLERHLLGEAP